MGNVKKIALITSTSNFERHKNTIRAVHRKLKELGGYALYVLTSYGLFVEEKAYDKGEGAIYSLLDEADFDGCIIEANFGVQEMLDGFVTKLKEKGIPFVAANFGTEEAPHVLIDGYYSACQMVSHLIEEHHCKKINFVSTVKNDKIVADSVRGYIDTLKQHGIEVEERRMLYRSVSINAGRKLADEFIKANIDDAEAVVTVHDVHSIGLCLELQDRGYTIPDDILVCSLNRSSNSMAFRPSISGVDRMDGKIVEKACDLLIDMMAGKEVPLENYSKGEAQYTHSCGCESGRTQKSDREHQQLVLAKIEMGTQIRQMMHYNDSLDEVESLEGLMANLQSMYEGLECGQFVICLNQGAINYISSNKEFTTPENGKFFDSTMQAVRGYTELTGQLENVMFPIGQLVPFEAREGDLLLFYPVHHIEKVYGYMVFINEYLPVDLYNYRICHESIASSMDNLHRQMSLRKSIDMLDQLHLHDALTGLYNRHAWIRFSDDYTEKEAYCVAYMDMDGLKKINDSHGHDAGNVAIKTTAEAIKSSMRENDLVTRLGGDEFLVLSSRVDVNFWENIQKVINDKIKSQIEKKKIPYQFGVSFGYCISSPENPITFEECCKRADTLMYADKKERKAKQAQ